MTKLSRIVEALIHRVDAELTVGAVTPLDPQLAGDGVLECLEWMYGSLPGWARWEHDGSRVLVHVADTGHRALVGLGRATGRNPRSGDEIDASRFSNVRIEVELAFVLKTPLAGPDCTLEDALAAVDYAVPALEILNSHIELEGRTIVDTISDNAAYGAMVLGDVHRRPDEIDLRWVPGVLSRNGEIEETGVAMGVLGHPATGVSWLANKFAQHGARLEAGEIILAGSFTRPMRVSAGDEVHADFGPMGVITCRFV